MEKTTRLDAIKGQKNIFDVDADQVLAGTDPIEFTAAHEKGGTTVISKALGSGITYNNAALGQFQIVLDPADTAALTWTDRMGTVRPARALVYSVSVDKGNTGDFQEVAEGVILLVDAVT